MLHHQYKVISGAKNSAEANEIEAGLILPSTTTTTVSQPKMPGFATSLYREDHSGLTFKQWAAAGVKRRSCRVICLLIAMIALAFLVLLFFYSTVYGWLHTRDPCVVAVEESHKLHSFPRKSNIEPSFKPVLPKIIHQQWKTDKIPEGVYSKFNKKFKELFPEPEYKHMLWTDETQRDLIKNTFPDFLETYDSYKFGIQRADSARYFILYTYGGLYADLDYEPLVNFWDHLPTDRVGLIESPYQFNELTQNSLMSSPKNDPIWLDAFNLLKERKHMPVLLATGPIFLDVFLKNAKDPYHVLPCENFQRLPFGLSEDEDHSPFHTKWHREFFGRMMPMKYCGNFHDSQCQYGKHHNTVSYLKDTGVLGPILG